MNKKQVFFCLFFVVTSFLVADSYLDTSDGSTVTRIPVWVFLETMPGATSEQAKASMPPRKALTEVSSFLLSGLVFGWDFSYTPYDKTRNVSEFFEITPKHEISPDDEALTITELVPAYPYLYCLAEYTASDIVAKRQISWRGLSYKSVKGFGKGERSDEVEGIYTAYINAAKDAIRTYAQSLTKNKPKEVIGELLVRGNPRLFVKSGQFNATLELYIKIDKIVPYSKF